MDHELRLYLFDINMTSGSFSAVRSVDQSGTTQNFVGDLASVGNLFDVGNNGLVFKLPYSAVKTLYTASKFINCRYNICCKTII